MMFVPRAVKRKPPPKKPVKATVTSDAANTSRSQSDGQNEKTLTCKSKPGIHIQPSTGQQCEKPSTLTQQECEKKTSSEVPPQGETVADVASQDESKPLSVEIRTKNVQNDLTSNRNESFIDKAERRIDGARTTSEITHAQKEAEHQETGETTDGVQEECGKQGSEPLDGSKDDEEEAPIISFSKNQRWPEEDEPKCVMCGRYGEYICSKTDVDVCSLECKARNLARNISRHAIPAGSLMELTGIPGIPVASNEDGKGESSQQQMEEVPQIAAPLIGYTYEEHEDISDLSREQVQELRAQVEIFVEGMDIPRPVVEFLHLNLPKTMQSNLETAGYLNPTPVQMQVIPTALCHRDTMVCAQTSSGKTASFLIPTILNMYDNVCHSSERVDCKEPLAVILAPTRELAMQIENQAKQLMKGMPNMKTALLVGGMPLPPQLHRLSKGIQLIIATPGRLIEIIQKNGVSFEAVKVLIIDEFDTMLHMGFQQQVMDIVVHLPEPHQTMLFSATIPKAREQLASTLLGNPVYISVGTPSTPCTSVKQIVMWVEEPSKKKKLFAILQDPKHYRPPIVVFVDSKLGADLLAETIGKICGISAVAIHGDKPQKERTDTLQGFLSGDHPIIVCTGVLARGIDLPGVTMVINFDMPSSVEEYIHQIGRTGRLGSKGTAVTFINNGAKHLFLEFVNTLKPLGIQLPLQLVNSQHLHNQKQRHHARKTQQEKHRKGPSTGYFERKRRETNWKSVGELLAKRKRKQKP